MNDGQALNPALWRRAAREILVLDGAMGTMIQAEGLGEDDFRGDHFAAHDQSLIGNNDLLSLTQPQLIHDIHARFLDAGADVIETNTFNATSISQADYGTEGFVYDMNVAAARIARAFRYAIGVLGHIRA